MNVELSVRKHLIDHGIKQTFIAEKCGWSKQKVNSLVNGKQKLTANDLVCICEAVGVPYDYFYNAAKAAQDSA